MTTHPTWSAASGDTADILQLIAEQHPATPTETAQWMFFVDMLVMEMEIDSGLINPNRLRDRLRGHVSPPRIGAYTRRALCAGLVEYSGTYVESDDVSSGNRGKPCRVLRWLGT
jgi:hypothetical protein